MFFIYNIYLHIYIITYIFVCTNICKIVCLRNWTSSFYVFLSGLCLFFTLTLGGFCLSHTLSIHCWTLATATHALMLASYVDLCHIMTQFALNSLSWMPTFNSAVDRGHSSCVKLFIQQLCIHIYVLVCNKSDNNNDTEVKWKRIWIKCFYGVCMSYGFSTISLYRLLAFHFSDLSKSFCVAFSFDKLFFGSL